MAHRNWGYSPNLTPSATRRLYAQLEQPSSPGPTDWPLIGLLLAISIGAAALLAVSCIALGGVQ